ncbi:MAG: hypothetical protein A7315_06365 [Candidatus Altiarchaeales archaeon WOR_SM1_79]|nr:MAG: hypothetical protein A7315_06365 [Candidatus Altiarchaeales archaeon WOR_SM1_79]
MVNSRDDNPQNQLKEESTITKEVRIKDIERLKQMVYSNKSSKRKEVATLLCQEKHFNSDYLDFLKRLIKDGEEEVWKTASHAMGKFAFKNIDAYKEVIKFVSDDYFWVKKRGIHALGEFAKYDQRGMNGIIKLTSTGRKEIVEEAVKVLGESAINNEKAFRNLITLLRSREELIVQPAIFSMGVLAGKKNEALSELKPFLMDDNNFIRLWTACAIGDAARYNDEAFELYKSLIDNEDVYLRRGFSRGLAGISKLKPEESYELIEKAVEDSDRYVRTNAAQALGPITTINDEAFIQINRLLNDDRADIRRGAAEALLSIPNDMLMDILPLIIELARDEDYYLRSIAAFASVKIAETSKEDALRLLDMLVEDKDEYVRRDVAHALGDFPFYFAEDIFPFLKKLLEDREGIVKKETKKPLLISAKVKKEEILEIIPKLMKDFDEGVRENAAEVLGEIGEQDPERAFIHLRKLALDKSPRVREKAAWGIEKIFDMEPDLVFNRIRDLQIDGVAPEILELIEKLAKNEEIGRICWLYAKLKKEMDESNVEDWVARALDVVRAVKLLKFSEKTRSLYETLFLGIKAANINDIALIKFDSKPFITYDFFISEIDLNLISVLEELPEMALKYKQIEDLSDKHIFLGKMLSSIDSALENVQEEVLPDIMIIKHTLYNWRGILSQTMDGLKGKANIRIELRTKKVLPLDTLTLLLGIENTGESLAENLEVEVMTSDAYKIIDKTKKIPMLPHARKDSVEFRIKPKKNQDFRVEFNISYDDFEMKGKNIYFADMVSFIDIPPEFKYIPNPYITGGPIKPSSKGMFFGRDDVFEFIKNNISSISQNNVLILQGERRTGKTSILYQLPDILGPEYICVFLDGQEFGRATLDYLFYRLSKMITLSCSKINIEVNLPSSEEFKKDPWFVFKDKFLEGLSSVASDKYLVILFDEFEALEHAVTNNTMDAVIFDYIRNLMQHEEKLVFIFAGVHRLEEMMQDYWSVMFNIALYWKISFLEENEARKLITRPVEGYNMLYDDLAIEKIIRATACHPYFVQLLCRFLVNRHNTEKRNYITVQDVNEELVNVVEKAKPHFNFIWTLSSPYERILLAILPEILKKKALATVTDIFKECEVNRVEVPRAKITSALKTLTAKDILERVSNGAVHYRFKVDFIRMWVEKHQPLSKVIEEMGDELKEK